MNVCIISSYPPPPTGVATYTSKLCSALAGLGVKITVLSNTESSSRSKVRVVRAWRENSVTYPLRVLGYVASGGFDIIHIQHEYWLYGRGFRSVMFPLLLLLLRLLKRPFVVTMHCVIPRMELSKDFFKRHRLGENMTVIKRLYVVLYNKLVCLFASKVFVHLNIARDVLINDYAFNPKKVATIPHGADFVGRRTDQEKAKKKLGLDGKYVLLIFGEIRRGKGIEYAINSMQGVLKETLPCILVVAGMHDPQISPESAGYLEELTTLTRDLRLESHIKFRTNLSDREVMLYFSATDVAIFPYIEDEIIAASGPMLTALGYGKPVTATKLRRFSDYLKDEENALIVPPADSSSLAEAVISLLRNGESRDKFSEFSRGLTKSLCWKEVAGKTVAMYNKLINK